MANGDANSERAKKRGLIPAACCGYFCPLRSGQSGSSHFHAKRDTQILLPSASQTQEGKMNTESVERKPFFYDVTLRDGNQALRKPWNLDQKEKVFHQLIKLGVQGIEVGFSGASDMDFAATAHLARIAPEHIVISGLARAVEYDITKVWEAIHVSAQPRIHTFITTSPYNMEHVLRMSPDKVLEKARHAVALCKSVMGGRGSIQFSAEHFGDCRDNLDFVIDVFKAVIDAGATVINLPNTVERYRPLYFVEMVQKVAEAVPSHVTIAVHNHNDLGMATATTVESFFGGATQLETTINGLGERAGNTNMFEVACALYNCGIDVPINFGEIYETALHMEQWSDVPIYEKAPLIGSDVIAHRSGIHQDGASKTKGMTKGAYRAFDAAFIGRKEGDRLGFTSQSGKTAIFEILHDAGLPITIEEAAYLQPILKKISEVQGELVAKDIIAIYDKEIMRVSGPIKYIDGVSLGDGKYRFVFQIDQENLEIDGEGKGPVEACYQALHKLGLSFSLLEYKQVALDAEHVHFAAEAMSEIRLSGVGGKYPIVIGRGRDINTIQANFKAIVNGINMLIRAGVPVRQS